MKNTMIRVDYSFWHSTELLPEDISRFLLDVLGEKAVMKKVSGLLPHRLSDFSIHVKGPISEDE